MPKVKVDVQLLVTGGVGDGKTAITHRILRAIQADQGLQSICKLHPAQSYEILRGELTRLTFTGELMQNAEMKKPSAMYSAIPGYPNADAMLSYLVSVVNETELSKDLKDPKAHAEYKPFKVVIDTITGQMCEWRAGEKLSTRDRVITLLADVSSEPVGMHQDDASAPASQSAAGPTINVSIVGGDKPFATGGYVDRCASVSIPPNAKPIQDGRVQGIASMERLAGETDAEYRNRNKLGEFIVIPAYVPIQEGAAPEPDAHINKADRTLLMFTASIADQFQPVIYEEGVHPNGLVAGNKVQIIFDNGDLISGAVSEFSWRKGSSIADIVYYRRID